MREFYVLLFFFFGCKKHRNEIWTTHTKLNYTKTILPNISKSVWLIIACLLKHVIFTSVTNSKSKLSYLWFNSRIYIPYIYISIVYVVYMNEVIFDMFLLM